MVREDAIVDHLNERESDDMGRTGKVIATVTVVGMIVFAACQGQEDDVGYNPSVSGGGPTNPGAGGGGSSSGDGDGDMQDVGMGDDVGGGDAAGDAGGDAGFDREACRQEFVKAAVEGTVWYSLDCDNGLENDRNRCQSASPATEVILDLRNNDNSSYWLNILSYSAWGNKTNMSGEFCRGPTLRDQEVSWRMVGCNKIELQTGCGTTETATLEGNELRYNRGDEGVETMWKRQATSFQTRETAPPLGPNGQCFSRETAQDPACQDQ
jgi:hypothetical protein